MEDTDMGVFCKKNATFYYMEYGNVNGNRVTSIERILKTLVSRNLLVYDITLGPNQPRPEEQYKVISVREAKASNCKMEPIYISNHVKKTMEEQAAKQQEKTGRWGKRG